jgi:hypothetical protein
MMRTQVFPQAGAAAVQFDAPVRVERLAGEFAVLSGRVWVTRQGDLDDYVVEPGQRFFIEPADHVVVEPWTAGETVEVAWKAYPRLPRAEALPRGAAAFALRGLAAGAASVAFGLRRVELGLDALARSAAAMAKRAQGCIRAGDSIASAGTVQ